jgi:hypothetical protein
MSGMVPAAAGGATLREEVSLPHAPVGHQN